MEGMMEGSKVRKKGREKRIDGMMNEGRKEWK